MSRARADGKVQPWGALARAATRPAVVVAGLADGGRRRCWVGGVKRESPARWVLRWPLAARRLGEAAGDGDVGECWLLGMRLLGVGRLRAEQAESGRRRSRTRARAGSTSQKLNYAERCRAISLSSGRFSVAPLLAQVAVLLAAGCSSSAAGRGRGKRHARRRRAARRVLVPSGGGAMRPRPPTPVGGRPGSCSVVLGGSLLARVAPCRTLGAATLC